MKKLKYKIRKNISVSLELDIIVNLSDPEIIDLILTINKTFLIHFCVY